MLTKTLFLALAAGLASAGRIRNPRNVTSSAVDAGANSLPDVVTTTQVLDVYTTYCPEPTVLTFQDETYTVVAPTTLTITDCPCTIVEPCHTCAHPTGAPPQPTDDVPETPGTPGGETPEGNTPEGNTPEGNTPEGNPPSDNTPEGNTPEGNTPSDVPPVPAGAENRHVQLGVAALAALAGFFAM
ncbi:hypothetical protein N3K66_000442 [Trichothecium roseum]|uniref:Uncharacterized protein n=1 Tax=Trichothecium roseum TaxID=47278 RepID=A0ACC0VCR7_9HYPO|nr:hypothetical protein N3K66_000442 [Trichothecium roseum]